MRRILLAALAAVCLCTGILVTVPGDSSSAFALASSPDLNAHVISASRSTLTVGWTPSAGLGYVLQVDGGRVSNTWDPSLSQTRFALKSGKHVYAVLSVQPGPSGSVTYPPPVVTTPTTTTAPTTTVVTTQPTTTTTPSGPASVSLSTTGNDSTCSRNGSACKTFDQAFQTASCGDTVAVAGGNYPMTLPSQGAIEINAGHNCASNPVVFTCTSTVNFGAPVLALQPGLQGVSFVGSCFQIHVPYIGQGGDNRQTGHITFDGVHMDSFNCLGCNDVTIENSTVGPFVACGSPDAPAYAKCPAGSFWAQFPDGTDEAQQEPFVHSGSAGVDVNFHLINDHITGLSSLWDGTHTGGLLVWDSVGLQIVNSTFDHNAIYDVEFNAGSSDSGTTITGNHFGTPVMSMDPTNGGQDKPCVCDHEIGIGVGSGATDTNWVVSGNTIDVGWTTDGIPGTKYVNVVVKNNALGPQATCGHNDPGLTFSGNTTVAGGPTICG